MKEIEMDLDATVTRIAGEEDRTRFGTSGSNLNSDAEAPSRKPEEGEREMYGSGLVRSGEQTGAPETTKRNVKRRGGET
ncbi:hypothetical protein V6N12_029154 [Hibiscus sabdariffa]|uniref:Uncharacterized protein n=1 Tax=Hibiscus sabdariffa TaxID=183260 RepID=A0ABR2AN10_9ROSI